MNCYTMKTINFEKGLFDSFIDVTFVITMVNSSRNETIIKEINKIKPTKKVIIVYNTSYKHCEKKLYGKKINKSSIDLLYTVKYIFDRSTQYNNILILEDDAKFSEDIFDIKHIKNIETFIKKNSFNTYSLGSVEMIGSIWGTHRKLFLKGGTHAMIYSKNFRKNFNKYKYSDIEHATNYPYNTNGWRYYKVLVGQIFDKTENSKNWAFVLGIFQPIAYYFTKDDPVEGITHINLIIKMITIIIIFIIVKFIYNKRNR